MAGITNAGFRRLCREQGAGLLRLRDDHFARAGGDATRCTFRMIAFDPDEHAALDAALRRRPGDGRRARCGWSSSETSPTTSTSTSAARSPRSPGAAAGRRCPTSGGCSSAIVRAAVAQRRAACPLTVKMRIGIDDEHRTYLDAGRIAADAGVAAVALHARTAAQRYSGTADWSAIARLRDALPAERPGARQRRHLQRGRRAGDGGADRLRRRRRRARLPRAGRGSSATSRPRSPAARCPRRRRSAQVAATHAPPRGAARPRTMGDATRASATCASTSPGTSRASRSAPSCAAGSGWSAASTSSTSCSRSSTPTSRSRPTPTARAAGRARPGRVVLPERWLDDPDDPSVPCGAELEHSGG